MQFGGVLGSTERSSDPILRHTARTPYYGSTGNTVEEGNRRVKMADGLGSNTHSLSRTSSSGYDPTVETSRYRKISRAGVYIPPRHWRAMDVLRAFLQWRGVSSHSNAIHTNKYTILTFVPKNLFEQFHRFANLYFLLVIVLSFIPAVEAYAKEIVWIPLAFVLAVIAVKDALEDYWRYRSDKEVNRRLCTVYSR